MPGWGAPRARAATGRAAVCTRYSNYKSIASFETGRGALKNRVRFARIIFCRLQKPALKFVFHRHSVAFPEREMRNDRIVDIS